MTADEAAAAVMAALSRAHVPFMVVGSLASNFHGVPRATRDADLVIDLAAGTLDALVAGLDESLTFEAQGAFEAVTGTTRYLVTLARSPFVCELFLLSDDPHDRARFTRRQRVTLFGQEAFVATAEDMVVTKLRWASGAGRTKDRLDIENMIAVRGGDLDWRYIEQWCAEHGTQALLDQIRRERG